MATTEPLKKILLVDDNLLFLKMMSHAFSKAGFVCMTAESAQQAIELLALDKPDAILSDYWMPEMNGLDFRRYLIGKPDLKNIPFIFLTDFSDINLVNAGLNLEAIDYVIKNTPVNVIVSKLNNLITAVSKQRELSENEVKKAVAALNIRSVPQQAPQITGYEVNFWHRSFQDIPGGDFIDFIKVTDRFTFIVLGDVMGKKWMAWFLSFSFLSYVRSAVRFGVSSQEYTVAGILEKINHIIYGDDALKDILSSLSLVMIDHADNKLAYAGAGDLPIVHYRAVDNSFSSLQCSGLLLGLFEEGMYDQQEITMEAQDQLFVFTDGIIDYAVDGVVKSDYKLFLAKLEKLVDHTNSFQKLKDFLAGQPTDHLVDDCSIIHIYKNN